MSNTRYRSWGLVTDEPQIAQAPTWASDALQLPAGKTLLPFGNGRSYGDSCLNTGGELLDSKALDRFISLDTQSGVLVAEPGVTLNNILQHVVPLGWFLPVSPGTSYVTLGGAVANDVHGKNHHRDGTFGNFVHEFTVLRSDGTHLVCSASENTKMFNATLGGLGLTGVITRITLQLIPINSAYLDVHMAVFRGIDEFQVLSDKYRNDYQYTVAWLDCASGGKQFARGIFMAANHASSGALQPGPKAPRLSIPFNFPRWVLNRYSIKAFNELYFRWQRSLTTQPQTQHYQGFFYPLDAIGSWNRIYGAAGFHQYQFVVPFDKADVLESILYDIVDSGMGSFLAVLKEFGDVPSTGMLSFPRPGLCLALDFADRGARTIRLIQNLDAKVRAAGGAAYPAKDRLMSADSFEHYFDRLSEFKQYVDPAFSSGFWRRVTREA